MPWTRQNPKISIWETFPNLQNHLEILESFFNQDVVSPGFFTDSHDTQPAGMIVRVEKDSPVETTLIHGNENSIGLDHLLKWTRSNWKKIELDWIKLKEGRITARLD